MCGSELKSLNNVSEDKFFSFKYVSENLLITLPYFANLLSRFDRLNFSEKNTEKSLVFVTH